MQAAHLLTGEYLTSSVNPKGAEWPLCKVPIGRFTTILRNQRATLGRSPQPPFLADRMYRAADGKCMICGRSERGGKQLALDHNHKNGRLRGYLCHWCNKALGLFRDDVEIMRRAIAYLESDGE
jgi:hypothetical protein